MSKPVKKKTLYRVRRKLKENLTKESYKHHITVMANQRDICGFIAIIEFMFIIGLILAGWVF